MKYLKYVLRNARRNPVRSLLTVGSTAISLFLMMILASYFTINDEASASARDYNRIIVMSSQGFGGSVPIARVNDVAAMDGIVAASPMSWFGGKYGEETIPFAQFGVNPATFFAIYNELTVPADQLKEFQEDKTGCVIGRKLAEDRHLKLGDPLPLKGDVYPVDLKLVIRGIYNGPADRDLRMCVFQFDALDEALKREGAAGASGNAGIILARVKNAGLMVPLCRKIDAEYLNSDTPTRTQSEEAFGQMFSEMLGDLKGMMRNIGFAVVFSLILVAGNALAMALRERTTEVAVLKAIGFSKPLVLFLVLAEAVLVAGIGGVLGALGAKLFFEVVDAAKYSGGFLPFFYIPWSTALAGLALAFLIGFLSGLVPAVRAAQTPVVQGLRKVV